MVTTLRDMLVKKLMRDGRAEGELLGKQDMLIRILRHRLGELPPEIPERVRAIGDVGRLDALADEAFDAQSLAELSLD